MFFFVCFLLDVLSNTIDKYKEVFLNAKTQVITTCSNTLIWRGGADMEERRG